MFVWSAPLHFATLQKFCSFTLQLVSEACFPLHYITLQSDLLRYILLHRSLTNSFARLHYATLQFVSEACLRCFPLHSDIPVALSDPLRHPSAPLIGRCNDRVGQKCKLTPLVALFSTLCFQMCDWSLGCTLSNAGLGQQISSFEWMSCIWLLSTGQCGPVCPPASNQVLEMRMQKKSQTSQSAKRDCILLVQVYIVQAWACILFLSVLLLCQHVILHHCASM